MQSQQKKVKWSRGETADALEERTDTGITQVSVAKMENIIADIYGNISRRPALKMVSPQISNTPVMLDIQGGLPISEWELRQHPFTFVFTKNTDEYFIFVVGYETIQAFHIRNQKFVGISQIIDNTTGEPPIISKPYGNYGKASFAQSNNWGVLSNILNDTIVLKLNPDNNTFSFETFKFSAPWYAPDGTQSIQISSTEIPGLSFDSSSIGNYTYTEFNGVTTVYSWIKTGLTSTISGTWTGPTTTYYYHTNNNAITWFDTNATGGITNTPITLTNGQTYTNGQTLVTVGIIPITIQIGVRAYLTDLGMSTLDVTENMNIISPAIAGIIPAGSIVQFPNNAAYMRVEGYDTDSSNNLRMYGSFLTPVANDHTTDSIVKVEKGYVSLRNYKPTEFMFSQQRLYATKWMDKTNVLQEELPGYIVASQVARFNDFKNNYNLQNEPIIIDINTQYQEQVNFIVDYNGTKIFTTDSEYAYSTQNGVVKQSTNGSSEQVRPAVFGSTLLYVDKTNKQLRALQYELQTDIFQSNVLNTMCKKELINNPISISTNYDKEHNTGSFIYLVQEATNTLSGNLLEYTQPAPIAVCNFTPGNQAEIWARWTVPYMNINNYMVVASITQPTIVNSVSVFNKIWFVVLGQSYIRGDEHNRRYLGYSLAELDYDADLDFEINASPSDTKYSLTRNIEPTVNFSLAGWSVGLNAIYTKYGESVSAGSFVYNRSGTQIGTVTSIDTDVTPNKILVDGVNYTRNLDYDIIVNDITFPYATVSVFDGDQYMWDDTLDANGNYTKSLSTLQNARVGFMVNATLESHPLDIQGKTYTEKKRIGKCVAVIRNTDDKAFTVCDKTGYTSTDKKTVNFYGCTGMKDKVQYTIKNIKGAKFTIESLTMIIEYGTLDS